MMVSVRRFGDRLVKDRKRKGRTMLLIVCALAIEERRMPSNTTRKGWGEVTGPVMPIVPVGLREIHNKTSTARLLTSWRPP